MNILQSHDDKVDLLSKNIVECNLHNNLQDKFVYISCLSILVYSYNDRLYGRNHLHFYNYTFLRNFFHKNLFHKGLSNLIQSNQMYIDIHQLLDYKCHRSDKSKMQGNLRRMFPQYILVHKQDPSSLIHNYTCQ